MAAKKRPHFPKGDKLRKALTQNPKAKAELKTLNLRIDTKTGRLVSLFGLGCFVYFTREDPQCPPKATKKGPKAGS